MADNQQQSKRREPHVFDDSKLRLYGPVVKDGGKKPSFRIKLYENNPVFDVDYGYATDKGYRVSHETPIDPVVFRQFLIYLSQVAKSSGAAAVMMENDGHPWIWDKDLGKNQRSKERMSVSTIEIGKNDQGVVYLKYITHRNPEVTFSFTNEPLDYHRFKAGDGSPLQTGRSSANLALAWADSLESVYFPYYSLKWTEPEWRRRFRMEQAQKNSGNKGGYGGNNGGEQRPQGNPADAGQAGAYTPPSSNDDSGDDFGYDDHIPF